MLAEATMDLVANPERNPRNHAFCESHSYTEGSQPDWEEEEADLVAGVPRRQAENSDW